MSATGCRFSSPSTLRPAVTKSGRRTLESCSLAKHLDVLKRVGSPHLCPYRKRPLRWYKVSNDLSLCCCTTIKSPSELSHVIHLTVRTSFNSRGGVTRKTVKSTSASAARSSTAAVSSVESTASQGDALTPDGWPRLTAIVVGASPAGALAALVLARQGFQVEVFESQEWDESACTWLEKHDGKSVLLTRRAWAALESVGLTREVEERGAQIHSVTSLSGHGARLKLVARKVTFKQHCISQADLTEVLIRAGMERYQDQIRYHFGMALKSADLENSTATFVSRKSTQASDENGRESAFTNAGELLVGADGLQSSMRYQMAAQAPRFSALLDCRRVGKAVSLEVLPEMVAPSAEEPINPLQSSDFTFDSKCLTVWHRPPKMLAILPTSKTRMSFVFVGIGTEGQDAAGVSAQIQEHFPEIAHLFPADSDCCQKLATQKEQLDCSVHCSQFHYKQTVLLGGAAHAGFDTMGLGANLALEDALILNNLLEKKLQETKQRAHNEPELDVRKQLLIRTVASVLERFTAQRKPETDAAAWLSESGAKQPIPSIPTQSRFFGSLTGFLRGFTTGQDVLHQTLKPPRQVLRQVIIFRVLRFATLLMVVLAVAAALKTRMPQVWRALRARFV